MVLVLAARWRTGGPATAGDRLMQRKVEIEKRERAKKAIETRWRPENETYLSDGVTDKYKSETKKDSRAATAKIHEITEIGNY